MGRNKFSEDMMAVSQLIAPWKKIEQYQTGKNRLGPGAGQLVVGLTDLPRSCWTAALFDDLQVPFLVVTATTETAKTTYRDLTALVPEKQVLYFPQLELLPYEVFARNQEILVQRICVLDLLARQAPVIVVAPVEGLLRKIIPREVFLRYSMKLAIGQKVDPVQLAATFTRMGYEKENLVEIPGTFSIRGGVIDVYPLTEKLPVRLELFDEEIESIRSFALETQRSLEERTQVMITPAQEMPGDQCTLDAACQRLENEIARVLPSYSVATRQQVKGKFNVYVEQMKEGIVGTGMEQFLVHFYPEADSLIRYLAPAGVVVVHEPDLVKKTVTDFGTENQSLYYDLLEEGKILPSFGENFLDYPLFQKECSDNSTLLFAHLPEDGDFPLSGRYTMGSRELPAYKGDFSRLEDDLKLYSGKGYQIFLTAGSRIRVEKMQELVREMEIGSIKVLNAAVSRGFESDTVKMLVLSETDVLGQSLRTRSRRSLKKGEKIATFLDLKVGDYVVHVNHGIGRYLGVVRLEIGDAKRDYLHIQYAGNDKLYVPTDQVDLVQKYIGSEGHQPKLNKLGGTEWNRVKTKVRHSVQDMARELLALYAAREAISGYAFSPDTVWQQEFEDAFPYPETPDQIRSVEEIKNDMEKSRAMDRLLCGDVGYGKTEVALRAAFKTVMDGKQVAFLVPTTVLAEQHQRTFLERLDGFPVSIGVLSRFKSTKAISQTLKGLARGTVDIVIGTHRLLSKDVRFKNLGLLVIDEEQRFGVAHKEKIKGLKNNIDVLTLSATPIPRTLHMSLIGVRDMSVIETPPEDRQPVQTYVMEFQERVIKEAISREMVRGGQVYFVHNRVSSIFRMAEDIGRLVPKARVLVAHGQMRENDLEEVMMNFVEGNADVLVCTTIVESGLDIPNVNTLIVDQADHFGLSQLYQLRGRVGRSDKQAFAYFTYRKDKILSEVAKKRLTAIRDFTELGSGFKIAMRDLEIRGAGNILGPEQHGHILAVGFDMYCRLVEEEVNKQRYGAAAVPEKVTPQLELNLNAFVPDSYVGETELKIELYKRLAAAEEFSEIADLALEVEDRYGPMPEPVDNLFSLGRVKVLAQKLGIAVVTGQKNLVTLRFAPGRDIPGNQLAELARDFGRRVSFGVVGDLEIKVKTGGVTSNHVLPMVVKIMEKLLSFREDSPVI